jgi:hypothetical protein
MVFGLVSKYISSMKSATKVFCGQGWRMESHPFFPIRDLYQQRWSNYSKAADNAMIAFFP